MYPDVVDGEIVEGPFSAVFNPIQCVVWSQRDVILRSRRGSKKGIQEERSRRAVKKSLTEKFKTSFRRRPFERSRRALKKFIFNEEVI